MVVNSIHSSWGLENIPGVRSWLVVAVDLVHLDWVAVTAVGKAPRVDSGGSKFPCN